MTPREHVGFACLFEPPARVHSHGLEQAVPAAAVLDRHERLLDETRERVCDRHRLEAVARADLFTRLQLEAAGEDREPAE